MQDHDLPEGFLEGLSRLEDAYLEESDPIRRSGFGGGAERWRSERSPILEAVESDGDLLDIGCANGYLAESLVDWARERGLHLTPHGVDIGARLIAEARRRLSAFAENFHLGNAWDWEPPRRYRYVYSLYDCVPNSHLAAYLRRLMAEVVAPGGRLIVGAYGSRSRRLEPFDVPGFMSTHGIEVAGTAWGGDPPLTVFAWADAPA